ncbi:MAG: hypothetical protein JRG73_11840 [Deltaproteobacteria bacterium]|nr:hypothetical protein [Deltaproteobacteria bacterium]MBW2307613.1 hypothetical protein [Deltaproteobacteria bacterium]
MLFLSFGVINASVDSASAEGAGEFSGFVAADVRVFADSPAFPEQQRNTVSPSLLFQPEYRYEWNDGKDRLTVVPFAHIEFDDEERRHFDLRELNWLHVGADWDLLVGVGKVFWGVTESRHLVNIINQTDLVEDPDEEDKLGQPMLKLALPRDWGTLTLFVLPRFRERTFPGRKGRLRGEIPVDTDRPVYDTSLEEWHLDLAARWTHTLGDWDIGLAHFWGTNREPRLLPDQDNAVRPVLIPRYDLIHQTSLDVQFTTGGWLWKLEAITRGGHGARFAALVVGFEYTFFGVFGTAADLGVLGEYLYDGRGDDAPATPFDDDVFVGARLALNDPQSTEVLAGAIVDRDTQATFANVEASRRFGDRWTIELEARAFINIQPSDVLFGLRRDDYVQIRVARYF